MTISNVLAMKCSAKLQIFGLVFVLALVSNVSAQQVNTNEGLTHIERIRETVLVNPLDALTMVDYGDAPVEKTMWDE